MDGGETQPTREFVSACLIVRDEENLLGRCLASVRPWAGELVVVDTGSQDRTVAIAESAGARVIHFPWVDDFAKARNVSLDAAAREWALVIDADEVLVVDDADAFLAALGRGAPTSYAVECHHLYENGSITTSQVLRLFRRTEAGMRYRGAIHEQLIAVADGRSRPTPAGFLHLDHVGYQQAQVEAHRKPDRNYALTCRLIEASPSDPFAWFCMGEVARSDDEAIAAYERALGLIREQPQPELRRESYLLRLYVHLVSLHTRQGHTEAAERTTAKAIALFPESSDLRYARGRQRLAAGDHAAAAIDFEACLTEVAKRSPARFNPSATGFGAETDLARCRVHQGRLAEAEALLRSAIATSPKEFLLPKRMLCHLLMVGGRITEAMPLLAELAAAPLPESASAEVRHEHARYLERLALKEEAQQEWANIAGRQAVSVSQSTQEKKQ